MKSLLILTLLFTTAFMTSCSSTDEPSNDGNGTLSMSTQFASSGTVKSTTAPKGHTPEGLFVDSLKVTYAAIVISNLKMHAIDSSDSTDDGTIKTGPFLLVFDSSGARVEVSSPIPAGTYDRIKFEIHKLRGGIDDSLRILLDDFVTEDATMKFMGHVWVAGVKSNFTVYADNTENIQEFFEPSNIDVNENATTFITLELDPTVIFFDSGVLDPRDITNKNLIKKGIKDAFKALKKS